MKLLDRESLSALLKLCVFFGVTGGATVLLMMVLSQGLFQNTETYKARFSDVTGVAKGDDVRMSGVKVGTVTDVAVTKKRLARVTFTASRTAPLSAGDSV